MQEAYLNSMIDNWNNIPIVSTENGKFKLGTTGFSRLYIEGNTPEIVKTQLKELALKTLKNEPIEKIDYFFDVFNGKLA
jgi:hypothetical protein